MGQAARARTAEARDQRRLALRRSARALLEQPSAPAFTMADVARRARLAKGTLFLYYPTREALLLDVLEELVHDWLDELHAAVASEGGPWPSRKLAAAISGSLAERPVLRRLLGSQAALEANVTTERRAGFRRRLLRRLFAIGALVEQRFELARAGDGVELLRYALALVAGLVPTAQPVPAGPGPDPDLATALTVLFNGFHRRA